MGKYSGGFVVAPASRRPAHVPLASRRLCDVAPASRSPRRRLAAPPLPTVLHAPFRSRSNLFAVRLLAWLTLVGLAPDCPAIPRGKRREYGAKQVLVRMRL